jgi:uncharacterized membrane protein
MGKNDDSKILAIIAYILGIVGFLIIFVAKRNDKFAMYHGKQALVLGIAEIIAWIAVLILSAILAFIPVLGALLSTLLTLAYIVAVIYLVIVGIMNAANMKEKQLPYIGQYAEKFKF